MARTASQPNCACYQACLNDPDPDAIASALALRCLLAEMAGIEGHIAYQEAGIEPTPPLATALFYGIKTDTWGLVRGASPADVAAYFYLQPRIDVEALVKIERAQVPAVYFARLDAALHAARVYDGLIISYVGPMRRPDLAAEMADLLARLKGMRWVICMGVYRGELILAVRSQSRRVGAGQLVRAIVGDEGTAGGHGTMALGHVPLREQSPERMADQLGQRALQYLGISEAVAGKPLLEADLTYRRTTSGR